MPSRLPSVPCRPRSRSRLQRFKALLLVVAAVVLSGCVTQQVTQVTLSGVVVGDRAMTGVVGPDLVRLTRGAGEVAVQPEMVLEPGDAISTGPGAAVVVSYPSGARAYIYPNTRASIGSLFVQIGKVFVKVRGAFQVKTTFVTAASEGTQYWVDVQPGGVRTVVVEGRVKLYSNAGAWSTMLNPNQQAVARGDLPQVTGPADPADISREVEWVRHKDALVPLKAGVNAALIGVGAAAAAGLWYMNRKDKKDPPRRPPPGQSEPPGRGTPQPVPQTTPQSLPMPGPTTTPRSRTSIPDSLPSSSPVLR